ncbi:MAG: hypothetical protein KKB59_15520 [Spirochaetes bacterium]|nr:hypothetical protein [Spirochaetota bacterium]
MSPAIQAALVAVAVGAAAAYAVVSAIRAARGKRPSCCLPGADVTEAGAGDSPCRACRGCGERGDGARGG